KFRKPVEEVNVDTFVHKTHIKVQRIVVISLEKPVIVTLNNVEYTFEKTAIIQPKPRQQPLLPRDIRSNYQRRFAKRCVFCSCIHQIDELHALLAKTTFVVVVLATLTTAEETQKPGDVTKVEELNPATTDQTFNSQQFGERQWKAKRATVVNNKGEQFHIKVVKKPAKSGKTIHLYPMKKIEKKSQLQPK
ncbi:hypothetical protein Bhyg_04777, partial [Pseudolycoriella hygida]